METLSDKVKGHWVPTEAVKLFIEQFNDIKCVCMKGQNPCYFCKLLTKLAGDKLI